MTRKIAVFTGTRAEFGILTPVMDAIEKHPNLNLDIIMTGMHMSKEFGQTSKLVRERYPNVHSFPLKTSKDTSNATIENMAECMLNTSKIITETNPDIFLFLGDRFETYAAATTAMMYKIPLAHVHGGDKTKAGLDESFRHALTKISNVHFPATQTSASRIESMGENPEHIFNVGSPSLDTILSQSIPPKKEILEEYGIKGAYPLALMIQHPITTQTESAEFQIQETLEGLKSRDLEVIIIYPNNDQGYKSIIREINENKKNPNFHLFKNIPHNDYIALLSYADLMIGNSSSGMIDASTFSTPVINIGIRQEGRERGNNVIDCIHDRKAITESIDTALYDPDFRETISNPNSPYGNGNAGKKIAEILSTIEIDHNLIQKQISY